MPEKHGVHSFYDNGDQLKQQIPEFRDRTSLFHDEISRGNASLLLMRVKVEDKGPYLCYTSTASNSLPKTIELTVEGESPSTRTAPAAERKRKRSSVGVSSVLFHAPTLSLQLWSVRSTSCRKMTESPAAQRGSTQNQNSAGPPTLRK